MTTEHETNHGRSPRLALAVYRHVTAVLGALGIAALLQELVNWRGFVAGIIGYWDQYVRPITEWVTHVVVTLPLRMVDVHVVVPLGVRDYLTAGFILGLSMARVLLDIPDELAVARMTGRRGYLSLAQDVVGLVLLLGMLFWPLTLAYLAIIALFTSPAPSRSEALQTARRERHEILLSVSPLAYVGILVAVNFILL